ncbi:protein FAM83G [Thunnus albacares]|uniref:protein FAM83G n=1 Tax=Thunnus albacares TaxID=8236 RepID=UPI001CF6CEC9|nr:protein FAM83G [Thunnus albacares]
MSNSQEQSLDENVVFLPVIETSPEFLYSEGERQAMERLLSFGPEAFYSSIGTKRSGCFLSPEEVSQITSWAQDYRCSELQVQKEENGENCNSVMGNLPSTYFPYYSDTPPPDLELGWPEKSSWVPMGNITVHTSPPAEGEPPVREIIRRHLQKANQVIAIVTDRLTDGAIINDLHIAASRGVPVYIILNERSIQENFTLNRLRHPNMRVRVLGGKTFCSREGKMVVGQLKDKFLLVDLQTVIHGSYSLTWTDAHLHRQLITVLSGPVVDCFDKEFRILFAASLPIPDTWRVASTHPDMAHQLKDISDLRSQKPLPLEHEITNPPSPPADSLLDWEAMGVMQRESCPDSPLDQHEKIIREEMPLRNNMLFDKKTPVVDGLTHNGGQFVDKRRVFENTSPVTKNVPDKSRTFNNAQQSDPATTDIMKRMERKIERAISRQLSKEKDTNADERTTRRLDDKESEPTLNAAMLSSTKRKEHSRRESMLVEERSMDETSSKVENTPCSRKPLILMVPQSERDGAVGDIWKRLCHQQSTSGLPRKGLQGTKSEVSRSMMDLSIHNTDTDQDDRAVPVPRLKASCFNPGHMTPALALMKKRNDDVKSTLYKTPMSSLPKQRPRSTTYTLSTDWRRSLAEREGKQE